VIVLDSSAAVEYLLGSGMGERVEARLIADFDLHAPHVLDLEVLNTLRRLVRTRAVAGTLARQALVDLAELDLTRYPHLPFVERVWELRANLSAHDAVFVALAEALGAELLTTDVRLAQAPGVRAVIVTP
jgi:predicted nucleic acid-binding protein